MSRTFTPLTGGGVGSAYQSGDKWGYQTAEKVRQALDMALYLAGHIDLGGDERSITSASWVAVNGARVLSLNGDNLGGLTLEAVVHYYTANAATTVQLRVRNVTDSTTAATSALSTATSVATETLTVTLASGVKSYRLELTGGNASNGVYGWGYLRLRKVPA